MQVSNPFTRLRDILTDHTHSSHSQSAIYPDSDEVLEVLASERRRRALKYLACQQPDDPIPVSKIAEEVAAAEYDCTVRELTSQQRNRVYISLQQQHMLRVNGSILDFNYDRMEVTPTQTPAQVWQAYCSFRDELTG